MVKKRSAKKKELKSIFISHASKDKVIVDAFVDLILHGGLSVPINEIFCTSTDGTKIKSGEAWRESIKGNLMNAKINFLVITPHYKESEVCMNEMGAAWVTSAKVIPFIVDPINYKTVGVIQEPTQIEKLLDEGSLDRVKDIIQQELDIPAELIKSDRWTRKKSEFLALVKKYLHKNPFDPIMDRALFNDLLLFKVNSDNKERIDQREKFLDDWNKCRELREQFWTCLNEAYHLFASGKEYLPVSLDGLIGAVKMPPNLPMGRGRVLDDWLNDNIKNLNADQRYMLAFVQTIYPAKEKRQGGVMEHSCIPKGEGKLFHDNRRGLSGFYEKWPAMIGVTNMLKSQQFKENELYILCWLDIALRQWTNDKERGKEEMYKLGNAAMSLRR